MQVGTLEAKLTMDGEQFAAVSTAARRQIADLGNQSEAEMRRMTREFGHGADAARGMGEAFKALSGNGQMSVQSLLELSRAPLAMTSPVGALTFGIGLAVDAYKALNAVQPVTKDEMSQVAEAVESTESQWKAYYKTIAEGGTAAEAEMARMAAAEESFAKASEKRVTEQVKGIEASIIAKQHEVDMLEIHAKALGDDSLAAQVGTIFTKEYWQAGMDGLTTEQERTKQVGALKDQIAALGKDERAYTDSLKEEVAEQANVEAAEKQRNKASAERAKHLDDLIKDLPKSTALTDDDRAAMADWTAKALAMADAQDKLKAETEAENEAKKESAKTSAMEIQVTDQVGHALLATAEAHGKSGQAMRQLERELATDIIRYATAEIFAKAGVAGASVAANQAGIVGPAAIAEGLAADAAIAALVATIPSFDRGGWVDAPRGTPILATVHGGERILTPEEQSRGGGRSVVIHVSNSFLSPGTGADYDQFLQRLGSDLARVATLG